MRVDCLRVLLDGLFVTHLDIGSLDGRPSDPMCHLILARISRIGFESMIERLCDGHYGRDGAGACRTVRVLLFMLSLFDLPAGDHALARGHGLPITRYRAHLGFQPPGLRNFSPALQRHPGLR